MTIPKGTIKAHVLDVHGVPNFRDLGGYRVSDGEAVACGLFFRSAELHLLRKDGLDRLGELGIGVCIDFRSTYERSQRPSPSLGDAIVEVHCPVLEAFDTEGFAQFMHSPSAHTEEDGFDRRVSGNLRILEAGGIQYARALEAVSRTPPVLFHCTAGKDRTGLFAALLLRLFGVSDVDICSDYSYSGLLLEGEFDRLHGAQLHLAGLAPDAESGSVESASVSASDEERSPSAKVMAATLSHLDTNWGGARGYFRAFGCSEPALDALVEQAVDGRGSRQSKS